VVDVSCKNDIQYRAHKTMVSSLLSHYRWLRRMGQPIPQH